MQSEHFVSMDDLELLRRARFTQRREAFEHMHHGIPKFNNSWLNRDKEAIGLCPCFPLLCSMFSRQGSWPKQGGGAVKWRSSFSGGGSQTPGAACGRAPAPSHEDIKGLNTPLCAQSALLERLSRSRIINDGSCRAILPPIFRLGSFFVADFAICMVVIPLEARHPEIHNHPTPRCRPQHELRDRTLST